ncbi:hypothetical protein SOVF_185030 [Spinacia oleracea]|nr:hypothetical protein SOVF_185030 [Spinacia oleracea]
MSKKKMEEWWSRKRRRWWSTIQLSSSTSSASTTPGEGVAFIIALDLAVPPSSSVEFLGLTNAFAGTDN